MPRTPVTASTANQSSITMPNQRPSGPVPCRCTMKSPTRMPMVIGTTAGWRAGTRTPSPSMAPSTEMTGVMTPSP